MKGRWMPGMMIFAANRLPRVVVCLLLALTIAFALPVFAAAPPDKNDPVERLIGRLRSGALSPDSFAREAIALAERNPAVLPSLATVLQNVPPAMSSVERELSFRIEETLATQSSSEARALRRALWQLLPADRPSAVAMSRMFDVAEKLEHFAAVNDIDSIVAMRGEVRSPAESHILEQQLTRILHVRAKEDLDHARPGAALLHLALIAPERRNQTTLDLVAEAVVSMQRAVDDHPDFLADEAWPFDQESVQDLVDERQASDPGVRIALAQLYSQRTVFLVRENNVESAMSCFDKVIALRPDRNDANTRLRLEIAHEARDPASRMFARGRILELEKSGELALRDRVQLIFDGYYDWRKPAAALLLLISIPALILLLAFRGASMRIPLPRIPLRKMYRRMRKKMTVRGQSPVPGYMREADTPDEYSQLLDIFGLKDSANDREIKQAFRELAKKYHPDLSGMDAGDYAEKFRQLEAAYERILAIRRSWFGGKRR